MQSSGARDAKVKFRDIKSALDLKLRGKYFCTTLTSKGQRGVFLSLYHQENYVRIQPAGKYAQTIWGWYSGSHERRKRKGSLKCKRKRHLHKFKADARTARYMCSFKQRRRNIVHPSLRLAVTYFKRRRCKRKHHFPSSYFNVEVVHTSILLFLSFHLRHSYELAITG